jgi:hypothetical protein
VSRTALVVLLLAGAAGGAVGVGSAEAGSVPADSGTFTMTSEPGDFVGGGRTYSYDAAALALGASYNGDVKVSVPGGFSVDLGAPGEEQLSPGTYEGAVNTPDASQPYLAVSGDGRACNATFGSFTVHDVEYGLHGYLESLHATFEQHCERAAPALHGEVDVEAAPPPAPLEVELTFDAEGTGIDEATGRFFLYGSIECSQEVVSATVIADVREVGRESNGVGSNGTSVQCSPAATDWVVTVGSSNNIPFTPGALEAEVRAEAIDQYYTDYRSEGFVYSRDEISASSEAAGSGSDPASEEPTDDGGAEAAEASDGLTGFIARDPALSLLFWLASLVAAVLVTALVALLVRRRRSPPRPGPSSPT